VYYESSISASTAAPSGERYAVGYEHGGVAYTMYPNPGDGRYTIARIGGVDEVVDASVLNVSGQVVDAAQLNFAKGESTLQLSTKTPGVYLLKLTDKKCVVSTLRFMLQ
jgi:hypothetical protein